MGYGFSGTKLLNFEDTAKCVCVFCTLWAAIAHPDLLPLQYIKPEYVVLFAEIQTFLLQNSFKQTLPHLSRYKHFGQIEPEFAHPEYFC